MGCNELEMIAADFTQAGEVLGELRRNGRTLSVSDGLVAAEAVRHGVLLLADDSHFSHYPGVTLSKG